MSVKDWILLFLSLISFFYPYPKKLDKYSGRVFSTGIAAFYAFVESYGSDGFVAEIMFVATLIMAGMCVYYIIRTIVERYKNISDGSLL